MPQYMHEVRVFYTVSFIIVYFSAGATSQAIDGDSLSQQLHRLNAVLVELQSVQSNLSAELPVRVAVQCSHANGYVGI